MSNMPPDSSNPYQSPETPQYHMYQQPYPPRASGMSIFCVVMFIVSLVFSLLRVPLVLLSFLGLAMIQREGPHELLPTVWFEIGTGIGLALFGTLGNALMLMKVRTGVWLGYLTALSAAGSIAVGIWQGVIQIGMLPPGPERTGMMGGAVVMVCIRLVIVGLYVAALVQFAAWARQRRESDHPY